MSRNTYNSTSTTSNSCSAILYKWTMNQLFSISFGHMPLRNSTDARKLVAFVTDPPVLDKYESSTIHTQTASTEPVHAFSMQSQRLKICLSTVPTSPTRLLKHLHLNRDSSFILIGPSTIGGSIKRANHLSLTDMSYRSLELCKVIQNPLDYGKNTSIGFYGTLD